MLNITTGNCGNSYPMIRRKRRPSTLIIPGEKKWKRWSPEEDQKLAEYVKNNGDKDWSHVHFETGLLKNRKSCRLRWKNYLDPNIKRGALNEDEEHLIIRLHNLVGNRWSIIAGRLSGRTDNDIKNYWYTKVIKKCLTIDELNCKMNTELEKFKKMEIPTFRPPSPINNLVNGDREEEKLSLKSMYDLTKFLGLD